MPQINSCTWDGDSNLTFRNPLNCWSLLVDFRSLVVEVKPLEVEFRHLVSGGPFFCLWEWELYIYASRSLFSTQEIGFGALKVSLDSESPFLATGSI